ncbi:MAG: aminopeptidase P family protein [Bacteroidales bacterium]|nr:aminopeptidase P family protein [Bacteroidales bacterium]
MFEPVVYQRRREKLKQPINGGLIFLPGNIDVSMNYPANTYHWRQDSDFLYFFGLDFQSLAGIIDIDEGKEYLFGDDLTIDDIIWMGPQESMKERGKKAGVDHVEPYRHLRTHLEKAKNAGRTIHYLPQYRAENKLLFQDILGIGLEETRSQASVELIKSVVALRSVKEEFEIEQLEMAAAIGYEMHITAMKMAFPGQHEQVIAGTIEGIAIKHGGMASFPVILSQHGETLHNHDHSLELKKGNMLLVDAGAESLLHYASDFTRTIPVGGKFTTRQLEIYNIVMHANNSAFKRIKPGVTYQDIHLHASKEIAEGLTALGLMKGDPEEAVKAGAHALFFPHGLGHMMGLDVHDMENLGEDFVGYDEQTSRIKQFGTAYLRMGRALKPGFVITNEPGIYFIPALIDIWKKEQKFPQFLNYDKIESYKDFGGIRLEDDILVTQDGCKFIGKRLPITPEQIWETMNSK